jgi:hypothetical protein
VLRKLASLSTRQKCRKRNDNELQSYNSVPCDSKVVLQLLSAAESKQILQEASNAWQ